LNIVIDAQIVGWHLAELRGAMTDCSHPPSVLFATLGVSDTAFLDDGDQIESEWRRTTDPDWFDQWYADLLERGAAVIIPVPTARALLRQLHRDDGFPYTRDGWYVSTAVEVVQRRGECSIISEDLDFYDPRAKRGCSPARRRQILGGSRGPVARRLRRAASVEVRSVASHCE
jgi:hypothetical protein